jgi:hypothetical protein
MYVCMRCSQKPEINLLWTNQIILKLEKILIAEIVNKLGKLKKKKKKNIVISGRYNVEWVFLDQVVTLSHLGVLSLYFRIITACSS